MASLSLRHVYKIYPGNVKAVSDFNLEIDDKEFIVFVGPSGCGKSTTLRMIAGLEEISAGELYIDGKLVNDVEPKDRDIAMVFQNYALYPHMTVYENMAFGLRLRKMASQEIDDRVKEAAAILGITPLLSRKPKALSGGQRQRVAWDAQSCVSLRSSFSTSLFPTSTQNCAYRCVPRLPSFTTNLPPLLYTSLTTRPRL